MRWWGGRTGSTAASSCEGDGAGGGRAARGRRRRGRWEFTCRPSRPVPGAPGAAPPLPAEAAAAPSGKELSLRDRRGSPPHRHRPLAPQHEILRGRPPSRDVASSCPPRGAFSPSASSKRAFVPGLFLSLRVTAGLGGIPRDWRPFYRPSCIFPKLSGTTVILTSNGVFPLTFRPAPDIIHIFYFKMKPMYQ